MSDYYADKPLKPLGMQNATSLAAAISDSIGLQRFEVTLDKTQYVYYAGQRISGKVHLQLNSPISAIGVKLWYKGEGQVRFTNRLTGFRRRFSAEETYLHEETCLKKYDTGAEVKSDVFTFSLTLPEKLPCSFEGRYGRVRYSVRSTLEITADTQISTDPLPFTIAPVFNLNLHPLAPLPISENHTKSFAGHAEPLHMSTFLPVRGYVPGQTIPLKINLKNELSVDVKKLRIVFKKVVVYRTSDSVRKHKEIVVEIEQPVERNCQIYDSYFDVPAVPPSGTICNLIDVGYTLKVETCVDVNEWYYRMFHKNLKIRVGIFIGTVPLKNYEDPVESADESVGTSRGEKTIDTAAQEIGKSDVSNGLKYQHSQIYRSSKPERDDPTGYEGDSDGEVKPYSPMYRVYKFEDTKGKKAT